MADGYEVDPSALRTAAEAVDGLHPRLAQTGPALVASMSPVTAANAGYLTSEALTAFANGYSAAADDFARRLAGHASGLVDTASGYEQADQSLRDFRVDG